MLCNLTIADQGRVYYNFLTDGTEIKVVNGMLYAMCNGAFVVARDGQYELADGSRVTVRKGKLRHARMTKKWEEYVTADELDSEGELITKQ